MNERGKYHKMDGNKMPSVGMILANKLIIITNPPIGSDCTKSTYSFGGYKKDHRSK